MTPVAAYAAAAATDALVDGGLNPDGLDGTRAGVIVGSVFGGISETSRMHRLLTTGKKSRAGVVGNARQINSTAAGNLAAMLNFKARAYSVSTSFASAADNIGHAYELIKHGVMDVAVCGGAEEDCWLQIAPYFDNSGVLAVEYNARPTQACRPYDAARTGAVLSAGSGILLLESLEHALRRGAKIRAEIVGYGSANDGSDLFYPTGEGLKRAIQQALAEAADQGVHLIDYVNTDGTGTVLGDRIEAEVLRAVVGKGPLVSSTKGLTGHALGAAGALEAVYTLLMISDNFVAPTTNLESVAPECAGLNHVQTPIERGLSAVMNLHVGLGGFNSSIIFRKTEAT
jgi:3-oxoacyl-[acyl-carrier-protein] synthase-1